MIKAVIFDVGGVLIRTEDHSLRRKWETRLGLSPGESEEIVFNSKMGQEAQEGKISDEELWSWVAGYLQLGSDSAAFRRDFWAGDVLDRSLLTYIRSLRPQYQTAIISNATDALRESLTKEHQIAEDFDLIVGSAYEKVMKPNPKIFRVALNKLGRHPEECVFIDDFTHNIEAAKDLGMAVIHFQPGISIPDELTRLHVQPVEKMEA